MKTRIVLLFACITVTMSAGAQALYTLDASHVNTSIQSGYFKMGQPGPEARQLLVNSRYLTIGGVPAIPVMGELQYSRMPKDRWEDEILKMKAAGVTVIATYSFWIHHEEVEGSFDWSGNKDLRSFVKLCGRLGMLVYPRIGPWSHGEARNGGTPDWILRKKYLTDRSIDPVYQSYVERYFSQLGLQLKGLMYKDGGPVVGIQLENEYWKGRAGEPYIAWLKQTALKYGMDVPLYTVTGWGDGSIPKNEVIPLWGGYPDESWNPNIEKITGCGNYTFQPFRDDPTIGNAQVKKKEGYDYSPDPYFTCEMGVGIFNSIQRRPIIGALDGAGMIMSRIGSGANLLGYYIFAGGSNPLGLYSSMEENKDETGYFSELTPISYDFQAAIRENGLPAPSYYEVKRINYFLNEFGDLLAPMEPVFPAKTPATAASLQYAVRTKDNSGFLFGINYCRNNQRPLQRQARFRIKLKEETIAFPEEPIDLPDSSLFIWPLNLDMNGIRLVYATAQPLFRTRLAGQPVWVFTQDADILPEFCLDDTGIEKIDLPEGKGRLTKKDHHYLLSQLHPGNDCVITLIRKNAPVQKIILLSREEGRQAWLLPDKDGRRQLYLSRAGLYTEDDQLYMTDTIPNIEVLLLANKPANLFTAVKKVFPERALPCHATPKGALAGAQWLTTSVKSIDPSTLLYHREFQKEFSADDPAKIRSAKLILAPESDCRFRINDKWVDQPIRPGQLNVLDVTGYIRKGDNVLLMDFPFTTGDKAFAARVLVEYFNTDRLDLSTDTSWLNTDLYYFPATYGSKPVYPLSFTTPKPAESTAGARAALSAGPLPGFSAWSVPISCNYRDGLNNVYMALSYQGDRIAIRYNGRLIADGLNNNTGWLMDLRRGDDELECQELQIEVRPWKDLDKIYFDRSPSPASEGKASLDGIRFIPEYRAIIPIPGSGSFPATSASVTPTRAASPRISSRSAPAASAQPLPPPSLNAHGAGVLFQNGTWYLFGEVKKGPTRLVPGQDWEDYRVDAGGISCYESKDLVHWNYKGLALPPEKEDTGSDLHINRVIERPKVIYNESTHQYVMWMHIDREDYSYARAGVAVSDRPEGPYHYIRSIRPDGEMSRDMTLFKDDDGKAYLIYTSENNNTMHVALLTKDYLSTTGVYKRILIGQRREAPAVFKYNKKYYLITSLCSGWDPNAATYAVADSMLGDWRQKGDPCIGIDAGTTFHSQSAFVLPLHDSSFLFMADRWNKTNLENSTYLWLPFHLNNGMPQIGSPILKKMETHPLTIIDYNVHLLPTLIKSTGIKGQSVLRFYNARDSLLLEYTAPFTLTDSGANTGNYTETPPLTRYLTLGLETATGSPIPQAADCQVRLLKDPTQKPPTPRCSIDQYLRPFWRSDTIYNETVLLVASDRSPATGRLLYSPDKILSIKNFSLDTTYKKGIDYKVTDRTITRLPASRMHYRTAASFDTKNDLAWYDLQSQWVVVTYTHHDPWPGPVPACKGQHLSRLPHTIVAYGMSITRGMDVSGYDGVPPYMPSYMDLFVDGLKKYYPREDFKLYNAALPGATVSWGAQYAAQYINPLQPDLVVLDFGMNDFWRMRPEEFGDSIRSIMHTVKTKNPAAEFLLLANMQFDPDYILDTDKNKSFYKNNLTGYQRILKSLEGEGIISLDMTTLSGVIYQRKKAKDCIVNPLHPNDYLARWYAQGLLALLCP